jgi:hypothetical protein
MTVNFCSRGIIMIHPSHDDSDSDGSPTRMVTADGPDPLDPPIHPPTHGGTGPQQGLP